MVFVHLQIDIFPRIPHMNEMPLHCDVMNAIHPNTRDEDIDIYMVLSFHKDCHPDRFDR